jgi:hypothetical protein
MERTGEHRRGRCLSVGTSYRKDGFAAHDPPQSTRAMDNGKPPGIRLDQLRICIPHRTRGDNCVRVAEMSRVVTDEHGDASISQGSNNFRLRTVRASDDHTLLGHHAGNTAHARASYSNEVRAGNALGKVTAR